MTTAVSDGNRSLFAATRDIPYYKLGQRPTGRVTDVDEMMRHTGISDVHYSLTPATLPAGASRFIADTNHVLWTNPLTGETEVIGTVGGRYTLLQPTDVFGIFRGLGHPWEVMGIIDQGRGMFGAVEWEREITLDSNGANEKIKSSLIVKAANDGGGSVIGGRTSMRFTCFNMFTPYFKGLSDKFMVRHTASAQAKLALVRAEIKKTDTYFDLVETASREMFQTSLTDSAFWDIVNTLPEYKRPEADKKGAMTKWENKMGFVSQAWKAEPNETIRNTVYGAYQAVHEATQWGRNIQEGRSAASVVPGLTQGQENFWAAGAGFDNSVDKFRHGLFERFYSEVPNRTLSLV